MRLQKIVCAVAAFVVAGGCSTSEPGARAPSAAPSTSTMPSHQPSVITGPAGTVRATVAEPAARADVAVRSLRIEDSTGKLVTERSFREAPAELAETVPTGRYRVISWIRECGNPCGGVPDDKLGPPARVCGVKVEITENAVITVTVNAPADNDCTMATTS